MTLVVILLLWVAGMFLFVLFLAAINRACERSTLRSQGEANIRLHEARRMVELNQLKFEITRDAEQTRSEIDRELRERGP
jgi:hypothetical protein